jgi:hypothetical protein
VPIRGFKFSAFLSSAVENFMSFLKKSSGEIAFSGLSLGKHQKFGVVETCRFPGPREKMPECLANEHWRLPRHLPARRAAGN